MNDHLDDVQLVGYVEHTLTDAERERLDRHLAQCPACRARLADREAFRRRAYHGLREGLARVRSSSRIAFESVAPRLRRNRRLEMLRTRTRWLASTAVLAAVILVLVLLWSTLGPGRGRPASGMPTPMRRQEPVTITFACQDYQRDWYEQLSKAFHEEHPQITVQIVSADEILDQSTEGGVVTVSSDDIHKLARAADAFIESPGMLGDRPQDAVLDLSDLAAHDEQFSGDDFYPGALSPFQREDKLWGLPFEISTMFVYFNPALFDEAGVPPPEIGWTWDDLLDAAVRLTVREGNVVEQYGYVDQWSYALLLLAHQEAGGLIETRHEVPQARLDDPGVANAVRWYADLVREHAVMPDPNQDQGVLHRIVYDESPAIWTGGSWEWDNFQHRYDAGVVPFPEKDGEAAAYLQVRGYVVSAGTSHPQEAWRWIEWLTRQPPYRYASGVPARASVVEATDLWGGMDESLAATLQYNLAHAVDYPVYIIAPLRRTLQAALQGASIETSLAEGQAQANEALARLAAEVDQPGVEIVVAGPDPTPTPGGTSIRFNIPYGGEMEVYRPLVEQFHGEHPGIHVELGSSSDWSHAAQAAEADCFTAYAAGLYGATEALLPLDPLITEDPGFHTDLYYPAFLERVRIDGTLWGLPLDSDALLLYYNRDRFDEAGRPYPAIDWTPQDLVDAALALADPGGAPPAYGFYPQHGALVDGATYVAWLEGRLFDAAGYPTFDDPAVVEALTVYADLVSRASPPEAQEREGDRLSGITVSSSWGSHPGWVQSGSVAMWTDTYGRYTSAPPLSYVGVAPLPRGAVSFYATSSALFISRKTAYPEACWNWIAFLSAQPEAVRNLPVRRDVVEGDAWRAEADPLGTGETADAWLAIVERGDALQPPWVSQASYAGSGALYWFDVALEDVLAGALPPEALAEAQVKAAAFVDCIGEGDYQETWRACAQQADPDVVLSEE